jgi:cytochrome P450
VIRYLGLFNQERLLLTSPKALSEVLVTRAYDFVKPAEVVWILGRLLGHGVLLAEGDEHKAQRRNLSPAFSFRHVKDLYPILWNKSRECVQVMTEQVRPGSSDYYADKPQEAPVMVVYQWASRATLDIIGTAGMGHDFGSIRDPTNALYRTYQAMFKPTGQAKLLALMSTFLPGWLINLMPFKRNGDVRRAKAVLENVCADLVREKQEKLERKELDDVDILSVAMESGGFDERSLIDQLLTFLAAGHETTASALTWSIYQLAVNPDMQTRLRAEVRAKLPPLDAVDAVVTSRELDSLAYLNAVCSESLRYHSPVPAVQRIAIKDTIIEGNRVPAGTRIVACAAATNRDVTLWGPDAYQFNPDRWLVDSTTDDGKKKVKAAAAGGATSNYSFLTFLHGPRNCIGMNFARAELASLLAAWVGRFEFELADPAQRDEKNIDIRGMVTAKPHDGLRVRVKVVEGW